MPCGHFLEKSMCRDMPGVICTTHIADYRWGAVGERVVPSGLCQDSYIVACGGRGRSVPAGQLWPLFFPIDLSAWEPD